MFVQRYLSIIDPNDVDSKYDTNITVIRKGASEGMRELNKRIIDKQQQK